MSDIQNSGISLEELNRKVESIRQSLHEAEVFDREQEERSRRILADARIEAIRIVDEAHQQAGELREKAYQDGHQDALKEAEEIQSRRDDLMHEVDDLKTRKETLYGQLESISTQLKDMIEANKPEEPETAAEPAPEVVPVPASVEEVKAAEPATPAPAPVGEAVAAEPETPVPVPVEEVKAAEPETPVPAPVEEVRAVEPATPVPAPVEEAVAAEPETPVPAPAEEVKAVEPETPVPAPAEEVKAAEEEKTDKPKKKQAHIGRKILVAILVLLVAVAAIVFGLILGFGRATDNGVSGAAKKGDIIVYNRVDKYGEVGDVMMVKDESGKNRVRFIAAAEGDVVDVDTIGERLIVNDEIIAEEYVQDTNDQISYPHQISDSEYYMMCDNSDDVSHEGLYSIDRVKGRVVFVIHR